MSTVTASKGLGKGLQALMSESYNRPSVQAQFTEDAPKEGQISLILLDKLVAGQYQPRRHFHEEELRELSESIRHHGVMQPLVVRRISAGFEIIAGERRWRAAKLAQLKEIPAIVREISDVQALELGLIENIQRKDLNPLEEGAGYRRLIDEFSYTQETLAKIVGKSRSHIANLLRLETLPERIKQHIDSGELTMGHARAILSSKNPEEIANRIIEMNISVRETEDLVRTENAPNRPQKNAKKPRHSSRKNVEKNEDVVQLEQMLADNLGLRVSITTYSAKAGEVVIAYETLSELDEVLKRLGGSI